MYTCALLMHNDNDLPQRLVASCFILKKGKATVYLFTQTVTE